MKSILFISTIHRMTERILPALINYHERYDEVVILNLGQSSKNTKYASNKRYHEKLLLSSLKYIYNGSLISNKRDVRDIQFCLDSVDLIHKICEEHKIKAIVIDDSRVNKLNNLIGEFCKSKKIKLYANAHGNSDLSELEEAYCLKNPFYHKLFVFGKYEVDFLSKYFKKDIFLSGGIPENDAIQYVNNTEKQITVILNRVLSDNKLSEISFNKDSLQSMKLFELQKIFELPIVFKVKERMSDDIEKDIAHIHSLMTNNIDYNIQVNVEDEINFLSFSKIVLTYGSTMAFKACQMCIPTIIFKEMGQVGLFSKYKGTVSLGDEYINLINDLNHDYLKNFISNIVEYSTTFDSTKNYSDILYRELAI